MPHTSTNETSNTSSTVSTVIDFFEHWEQRDYVDAAIGAGFGMAFGVLLTLCIKSCVKGYQTRQYVKVDTTNDATTTVELAGRDDGNTGDSKVDV